MNVKIENINAYILFIQIKTIYNIMFKITDNNGFKDLKYVGEEILKDNVVFELKGKIINAPTKTSIEIGENLHIEDMHGMYMNHSCDPSCYIKDCKVYAKKNIVSGDSLTFNYDENETSMSCSFLCNCCGKLIKGKN